MRPKLFSDSHQDTALSYHCLGESQYALGDFDGALELLLTASTIRNDILLVIICSQPTLGTSRSHL